MDIVKLPDYVVINKPECLNKEVLKHPAQSLSFPLSPEDQKMIEILVEKFKQEKNCAGLAAPQIGFPKRVTVFEVADDPHLKKWRPDLTQTLPFSIWINPSYEGIGTDKTMDLEGCFSVDDLGGTVARFNKVSWRAYDLQGNLSEGTAEGFLARVIQHEIDHLNGILFIDLVAPQDLLPIEIYRKKRAAALRQGKEIPNFHSED